MYRFNIELFFISLIRLCDSSFGELPFESPLGIKEIKNKDERLFKLYKPDENLMYPGKDEEKLEKINNLWNTYYSCLKSKVQEERARKPVIIQIMEGQFTSMKCPICPRPFQGYDNLEWRYKPLTSDNNNPDEPEYLDLAPEMRLTRKKTLKIYNALMGYSGLYVCYYGNNSVSVYILEVVRDQEIQKLNELPTENDTLSLPGGSKIVVYYLWSKWTECSTCEIVGKKFRYGICMVILGETDPQTSNVSFNKLRVSKKRRHLQRKKAKTTEVLETDTGQAKEAENLLSKFGKGIPCTSHILPNVCKSLIESLNKTPTVALMEYCKVSCADSVIFETIDRGGNVLETANNSAGIYSTDQELPLLPPQVERITETADFGADVTLQCPGNLFSDIPVTWMVDQLILIPELATNITQGRISIDLLNKLHINHLRLKDSNIYSCWQRGKLAGTVRLNVNKTLSFAFDHHSLLLTMLSIAMTILYIGIKILKREIIMRKRLKLTT